MHLVHEGVSAAPGADFSLLEEEKRTQNSLRRIVRHVLSVFVQLHNRVYMLTQNAKDEQCT